MEKRIAEVIEYIEKEFGVDSYIACRVRQILLGGKLGEFKD